MVHGMIYPRIAVVGSGLRTYRFTADSLGYVKVILKHQSSALDLFFVWMHGVKVCADKRDFLASRSDGCTDFACT